MPPRSSPHPVLLVGATLEAAFLTIVFGYVATYVHLALGAPAELAVLATAAPTFAIFVGSMAWGRLAAHWRLRPLVPVGLIAYLGLGLLFLAVRAVAPLIWLSGLLALGTSALRPATAAYITAPGGAIGWRLGVLLRWQSVGWLGGGLLSGALLSREVGLFPLLLAAFGVALGVTGAAALRFLPEAEAAGWARPTPGLGLSRTAIAVLLSFFLLYAGWEGFWTTLGIYLHALHVSISWVGYTVALSTFFGLFTATPAGSAADRYGGHVVYVLVSALYCASYGLLALVGGAPMALIAFSLPLFPGLQVGVQRILAEHTPPPLLGQAMGAYNAASGIAVTAGTLVMGVSDSHLGVMATPDVTFALMAVGFALYWLIRPRRPEPETRGALF